VSAPVSQLVSKSVLARKRHPKVNSKQGVGHRLTPFFMGVLSDKPLHWLACPAA